MNDTTTGATSERASARTRAVRMRNLRARAMRAAIALPAAAVLALGPAGAALAAIDNTATASGTPVGAPAGADPLTATDSRSVNVEGRAAGLTVSKVATIGGGAVPAAGANVGDVIDYTYTVTNSGNVRLFDVTLQDVHDGAGPAPTPDNAVLTDNPRNDPDGDPIPGSEADSVLSGNDILVLAPGDAVTYTASYTVTQADVDTRGGSSAGTAPNNTATTNSAGDNDIDNVAIANAVYDPTPLITGGTTEPIDSDDPGGPSVTRGGTVDGTDNSGDEVAVNTARDFESVLLLIDQGISIAKTVTPTGAVVAGQELTYTYAVTNTGNTNLENVAVAETSFNGTGTPPVPTLDGVFDDASRTTLVADAATADGDGDGDVDTLAPGNVAFFTATYTVTQRDIDELQ